MRKIWISVVTIVLLLVPVTVQADGQKVFDEAGLLTESEIQELEQTIFTLEQQYNIDIVCLTIEDAKGKSSIKYAEDYYDATYGEDGMLFLIDMDNREIYATFTGTMLQYFTDQRQNVLLDDAYSYISNGDYMGTFTSFLNSAQSYLEAGIPAGQYTVREYSTAEKIQRFALQSVLAFFLAIGLGFLMMKVKTRKGRYYERRHSLERHLVPQVEYTTNTEHMFDSVTNRVYIPPVKSNTSSGSGGSRTTSHRSSSGRRHSGGGRKF